MASSRYDHVKYNARPPPSNVVTKDVAKSPGVMLDGAPLLWRKHSQAQRTIETRETYQ